MTKREIKPQKTARVASLRDLIKKAKSIAVVDYTKMTVPQATELRRQVHAAGGEVHVEKNTLFRIALQSSNDQIPNPKIQLRGLSAFIFSNNDEISALKVVSDFIKKNNVLTFKMGVLGDKVLTAQDTITLSQTPSKDISIAKIMYLLNYNMSRFVRTLDAIAKAR